MPSGDARVPDARLSAMAESTVRIEPPLADAQHVARAEMQRLAGAIRGRVEIRHIGSTAVAMLDAKPVVDLVMGAFDVESFACVREVLTVELGYVEEGSRPGHSWLRWPGSGPRRFHVHVVEHGGSVWAARIAFRDALQASGSLRERYAALKHDLAGEFPDDLGAYTRGKRRFVDAVLRSIGVQSEPPSC